MLALSTIVICSTELSGFHIDFSIDIRLYMTGCARHGHNGRSRQHQLRFQTYQRFETSLKGCSLYRLQRMQQVLARSNRNHRRGSSKTSHHRLQPQTPHTHRRTKSGSRLSQTPYTRTSEPCFSSRSPYTGGLTISRTRFVSCYHQRLPSVGRPPNSWRIQAHKKASPCNRKPKYR